MHKDISTTDFKWSKKLFWIRIWELKDHNRKIEEMNNMEQELQGLEEGTETIIHLLSIRATLKKSTE